MLHMDTRCAFSNLRVHGYDARVEIQGEDKQALNTNSSPYISTCAIRIQYELPQTNGVNHLYALVFAFPFIIRVGLFKHLERVRKKHG